MASQLVIRDYLSRRARWIWEIQSRAFRHGLSLQEETLTEILLLRMADERAAHGLTVTLFNKQAEAVNGADWEWIIQTPDCEIGLRVQAKRLYKHGTGQDYGGLKPGSPQVDKLIDQAGSFIPVYVFYNHGHGTSSSLLKAEGKHLHRHRYFWGCSVASAHAVKAVNSNRLKDLLKVMKPWHHLVTETGACGVYSVLGAPENRRLDMIAPSPLQEVIEQIDNQDFMLKYLTRKELAGVAVIALSDFEG
jgi:hypothetical protein